MTGQTSDYVLKLVGKENSKDHDPATTLHQLMVAKVAMEKIHSQETVCSKNVQV